MASEPDTTGPDTYKERSKRFQRQASSPSRRRRFERQPETEDGQVEKQTATNVLEAELPRTAAERAFEAEIAATEPRRTERSTVLRRLFALADVLAAIIGGLTGAAAAGLPLSSVLAFTALAALGWIAIALVLGLYSVDDLGSWASGIANIRRTMFTGLLLSWPLFALASLLDASRPVLAALVAAVGTVLPSLLARSALRGLLHRSAAFHQRTLIVGSGMVARQLAEKLQNFGEFGLEPVGVVDDDFHELGPTDIPRLGQLAHLPRILRASAIDRVIIGFSRASDEQLLQTLRTCREQGVAVDVVPRLFQFLDGARGLERVAGLPILSIGAARLTRSSRAAKRAFDLLGASLALLVLSPLLLLIAFAIKFESPGPVLFRQPRAGRKREAFYLLKFRTMYKGAEEEKHLFGDQNDLNDGVMFKIRNDPRITRVGRFLRRFSLDELPQLINVVRGEMGLVGPRPLIFPETDALGEAWEMRRLDLRPGITGPWQISGRNHIPFQEMVRLDYQYAVGWSLARDIEILIATIPAVLSGRGAY
jgi:exopolysaccharide biosynthesis polyprenyl glycosylphosphotransferase